MVRVNSRTVKDIQRNTVSKIKKDANKQKSPKGKFVSFHVATQRTSAPKMPWDLITLRNKCNPIKDRIQDNHYY